MFEPKVATAFESEDKRHMCCMSCSVNVRQCSDWLDVLNVTARRELENGSSNHDLDRWVPALFSVR